MSENLLENLIKLMSKLPGLGPRSARRAALHMIKHKDTLLKPLGEALLNTYDEIKMCEICGNVDTISPCNICNDSKRDQNILCVVEQVGDLWALERSKNFRGQYHVLGGTLSAIDAIGPEELGITKLILRVQKNNIQEVIIATNATVEGQTTAHYIYDQLKPLGVKTSRIAYGIPIGGELDYLDDGTLTAALKSRQSIS